MNEVTGKVEVIPSCQYGISGSPCVDFSRLRSRRGPDSKRQDWFETCVRDGTGESGRGYQSLIDFWVQNGVVEFANENVPFNNFKINV